MQRPQRRLRKRRLASGEALEQRCLLAAGIAWTDAQNLTLSFAPDGTDVAGHENTLHSFLGELGTQGEWRTKVREGIETWTDLVDADLDIVYDQGQAFGAAGAPYSDPRFGDIRIAAIPLDETLFAFSVPHDEFVGGTWAGDIIINSEADFTSLDDLFRVVLHEAGHVMGLDHSDDPNSPMFEHGIPSSDTPTAEDTTDLRELYGLDQGANDNGEQEESDDDDANNDDFDGAVPLNATEGYLKRRFSILGRISDAADVDYYSFQGYEDNGELEVTTFVLRSTERGKLLPDLAVLDSSGLPVNVDVLQHGNGTIVLQTEDIDAEDDYVVRVQSGGPGALAVGAYDLTIAFRAEEIEPREFGSGTLKEEEKEELYTVYLARAQLVSFSLEVEDGHEPPPANTTIGFAVFDHQGDLIRSTSAGVNEVRSLETLLLRAGTYYVSVRAEADAFLPDIDYELLSLKVTKEAGPLPSDPTGDPAFPCNDGTPDFCYPDGHRSTDPTHEEPGTGTDPPVLDPYAILLSWISFWPGDNDNSGWLDPNNDSFVLPTGSSQLDVLINDSGAAPLEVRSVTQPGIGSVSINADGSLQYDAGSFVGSQSFNYEIGAAQEAVTPQNFAGDGFGSSVSVFGNLAVIGAPFADANGVDSGSAYLYRRTNGAWQLEQTLIPADGAPKDRFGHSVSIHGTTIVVSSPRDDDKGTNSGSVYVFEFDPITKTFVEGKKVHDPQGRAKDLFGESVAVDGSTLVVGARLDDGLGTNSGSAFVFNRNRGGDQNWGIRRRTKASTAAAFTQFGSSVDIEGDYIVVGARRDDVDGVNSGGAYVFERNTGGAQRFGEVARLAPVGVGARDEFGTSVAISGGSVFVGAPLSDTTATNAGSAYLFEKDSGGTNKWGQTQQFLGNAKSDLFGHAVGLDGGVAVVGSPQSDIVAANAGSAIAYRLDPAAGWQQDYLITADVAARGDQFARSVAVSNGTVTLGAPRSDANGSLSGHFVVEDTRRSSAQVLVDTGAALRATEVVASMNSTSMHISGSLLLAQADEAARQWGLDTGVVSVQFAQLQGNLLGLTIGHRVLIDVDAAGHGWFVGSTGAGMSLETVVAHEVGHVAGLSDTYDREKHDSIMFGYLQPGEHRTIWGGSLLDELHLLFSESWRDSSNYR